MAPIASPEARPSAMATTRPDELNGMATLVSEIPWPCNRRKRPVETAGGKQAREKRLVGQDDIRERQRALIIRRREFAAGGSVSLGKGHFGGQLSSADAGEIQNTVDQRSGNIRFQLERSNAFNQRHMSVDFFTSRSGGLQVERVQPIAGAKCDRHRHIP